MIRGLVEAVLCLASLAAATAVLRLIHADGNDAVLGYLGVVVVIAFSARPTIASASAIVAAALTDALFLPPYGLAWPGLDGWLTLTAFLLAALAARWASSNRRAQVREREAFIAQLQENEAALERRVRERTEAVLVAEERLRLAARAANDALWDIDLTQKRLWWSEVFVSLFGHSTTPTFDEWIALLHPDDRGRVVDAVNNLLGGQGTKWRVEYRFRRGDGSYAWVLNRAYVVRDASGRAVRMIGAMMDITERKEAERMKSDFVSFVSHQLRTPLAGMSWMLELAADSGELTPTASEYVAEARQSAARLVTLVNDLLDIARLESGRVAASPERLDVNALTRSVLHELQTLVDDKTHRVTIDGAAPDAWADAQLIRQVIANLLSNAIKYTPPAGRIAIAITQDGASVQWSIADTGVGIPRAAQARLFERFYRADNAVAMEVEGTGLGLHLVRLIVEQAGGRVWCESEEGRGSTFSFTLPAAVEGVAAS